MWVNGLGKVPFVEAWRYDIQGAIYQEVVPPKHWKHLAFFILQVQLKRTKLTLKSWILNKAD